MPNRVVVGQDRAWFKYWPKYLPKTIDYPEVPLFEPLEATAKRYPNKPAIIITVVRLATGKYGNLY